MSSNQVDVDVLIVGAGPCGLFAAHELTRRKISIRIIEKAPTRSPFSRAIVVHCRTLELFAHANLEKRFLEEGNPVAGVHMMKSENGDIKSIAKFKLEDESIGSEYQFGLIIGQSHTETILNDALTSLGVTVERNITFLNAHIEGTGDDAIVVSELSYMGSDGNVIKQTVRSKYLLGCDGVHSGVRKSQSGWNFNGKVINGTFVTADVVLETELPVKELTIMFHRDGIMFVAPFDGESKTHRLVFNLDSETEKSIKFDNSAANDGVTHGITNANFQKFSEEQVRQILEHRTNGKVKLITASWISTFHINERKVAKYDFENRIFVVGDAAHCHSPAGGQGMNIGLQDAYDIAWKLAETLKSKSPSSILRTYHMERSPVAESVLALSSNLTDFATGNSIVVKSVRAILPYILKLKIPSTFARYSIMEIGFQYEKSIVVKDTGERLKDVRLTGGTLREKIKGHTGHVLIWSTGDKFDEHEIVKTGSHIKGQFGGIEDLKLVVITKPGAADTLQSIMGEEAYVFEDWDGVQDSNSKVKQGFGQVYKTHARLMLVRPDLIINASVPENSVNELKSFMEKYIPGYF